MEFKGTPGPWVVHPERAWITLEKDLDSPIAALCWPTQLRSEQETFLNARLISAAPELLSGAVHVLMLIDNAVDGFPQSEIEGIRAAIAKALGQNNG